MYHIITIKKIELVIGNELLAGHWLHVFYRHQINQTESQMDKLLHLWSMYLVVGSSFLYSFLAF